MTYLCNPIQRNGRSLKEFAKDFALNAEIAQLVEHDLAKVGVASSSLVFRSTEAIGNDGLFFYLCLAMPVFAIKCGRLPFILLNQIIMKKLFLIMSVSVCCLTAYAQKDTTEVLDKAVISTRYLSPVSVGGLELPIMDIPQSVSVVNPTRIKEFNMNTIDEALRDVPGVTIIANDYMRSQYKARGYNMSIMYDGLPAYNSLAISQQLDLSFYEQIEVLRGPAGMIQGAPDGQSLGGIINLVKKTPGKELGINTSLSYGSWNNYRGEIDINAPLDKKGKLRSRWVFFANDRDFFYDRSHARKAGAYGVIEWQPFQHTLFSLSYAYQDSKGDVLYNGIPAIRENADDQSRNHIDVDRSFNPTPDWDWTKWKTHEIFFRMNQRLAEKWNLSVKTNIRAQHQENKYGFAGTVSKDDNLSNYLRGYNDESIPRVTAAADVTGTFCLFNRTHHLFAGLNFENFVDDKQYLSAYQKFEWGDPFLVQDFQIPYDKLNKSKMKVTQGGVYAQLQFTIVRPLKLFLSGRLSTIQASMYDFSNSDWTVALEPKLHFTPSASLLYEPVRQITIYASYSDLYVPQTEKKADGSLIDPRTGAQYEVGTKMSFWNSRLNANVAAFYLRDNGRAYKTNPAENTYVNGGLVENKGVDIEVNAYPINGLELMTSYTYLDTKITKSSSGDEGLAFSPVEPEHSFKFLAAYRFNGNILNGLSLGAGVNAFSTSYASVLTPERNQKPYALLNAFASYRLNTHFSFYLNFNNITDTVYYARLGGNGDYFGDPFNFTLSLRCSF